MTNKKECCIYYMQNIYCPSRHYLEISSIMHITACHIDKLIVPPTHIPRWCYIRNSGSDSQIPQYQQLHFHGLCGTCLILISQITIFSSTKSIIHFQELIENVSNEGVTSLCYCRPLKKINSKF